MIKVCHLADPLHESSRLKQEQVRRIQQHQHNDKVQHHNTRLSAFKSKWMFHCRSVNMFWIYSNSKYVVSHIMKMSDYAESVLKPRQNSLLQQKMERHHRLTGETWKLSQGFPVGVSKLIITSATCCSTGNAFFCFVLFLKTIKNKSRHLYFCCAL